MIPKVPPLAELVDLLPDAVCVVDIEGQILFTNVGFERTLGYTPQEAHGRCIFDLIHPDDRKATRQQAEQVSAGMPQRHFRNRYFHKDGHDVDIQWSARWLPEHGVRVGVGREVSELRRAESELEHRASHDPLTGLPNRRRLHCELQDAITHAAQTGGCLAVLYLDLDGFKEVNDQAGHSAGDRLLREVAQRLQQGLRQGDLVARVGGDEFVALLPGCRNAAAARAVASDLRTRLNPPYMLADGLFQMDASIGIACYPVDGSDPDSLLAHADSAMYVAKRQRARAGDAGLTRGIGEVD